MDQTPAKLFTATELEAIARALGHTADGLTGSEISTILMQIRVNDFAPTETKWRRLYCAFAARQNQDQKRTAILAFIRVAMKPARHVQNQERYEILRTHLNRALAFSALAVREDGEVIPAQQARTLPEAERRARELRASLETRNVHPDVLQFCRAELLSDNYFHAVLEATKSVAEKLRAKTGLTDDGGTLVDRALGGTPPMLAINRLVNESERSEQKGFANLVKGTFGMFRNTIAHAPKILWQMSRDDAIDLLSLVSLIHRRLDNSHTPSRV
jgi:uncharacterized protein (TIGR02391 family)